MINRVLQLNISQLENSFNSLLEKHFVLDLPSQPNPNLIQLVIERGNLWSKKNTSCSREIVGKRLQGELGSSDRTGKPVKCEDNRVMNVHDSNGETCGISARSWFSRTSWYYIVKREQVQPCDWWGKTSTSTSQACQMRWWNDHIALTLTTWFSRSRITLNDKHFKVIFNNIKHSIPSAKNQKMRLWQLGTLNYAR